MLYLHVQAYIFHEDASAKVFNYNYVASLSEYKPKHKQNAKTLIINTEEITPRQMASQLHLFQLPLTCVCFSKQTETDGQSKYARTSSSVIMFKLYLKSS